jgi:hypothetical protein
MSLQTAAAMPACEAGNLRSLVKRIDLVEQRLERMERRTQTAVNQLHKRARYGVRSVEREIQRLSRQYSSELAACDEGNSRACSNARVSRELIEGLQETKEMIIPTNTTRLTSLYWKRLQRFSRPIQRKLKRAKNHIRSCI